tara:strand:+ start:1960 stop:3216 length:1257 start_codon:yes stop_codon:yes gene_type:complete
MLGRNKIQKNQFFAKIFMFFSIIGPGLITANIDNDAGGIATYSLAGAHTGLRLIWILIPITIALIIVQEMSARMGIVSGKGLADLIRERFGLKITFYTLFFLIYADLGNTMAEFAGIASAGEIFGISKYISVPLCGAFVLLLILKGDYKIVERFFLAGCLVYLSYVISGFYIAPDWSEISSALVKPDFKSIKPSDYAIIVGLIGTSITPWMQFYIQAAVVEKELETKHLLHNKIDVIVGCITMSIVTLFIIICCAATIYIAGGQVTSAKDAALALKPLAGEHAMTLFGIGLFNASIFSAALLPLATSYYVCEGMGWERGVDKHFKDAPQFFSIFISLVAFSITLVLIPNVNLFNILILSQIINGIFIPVVLFFIIKLCNDPEIMGEYTNSTIYNMFCYSIVFVMALANIMMIYYEIIK